jgi:hypothetical protein
MIPTRGPLMNRARFRSAITCVPPVLRAWGAVRLSALATLTINERRRWESYTKSLNRSKRHKWYAKTTLHSIFSKLTALQNRLLQMIRQQQAQLQLLQQQQQPNQPSSSGTAVVDDITPNSERSQPFPPLPPLPTPGSRPVQQGQPSFFNRRGSRAASEAMSPNLSALLPPLPTQPSPAIDPIHSSAGSEWSILGGASEAAASSSSARRSSSRDESAFYQAEAAMLTRENQMLQMRIRELERQLNELSSAAGNNTGPGEAGEEEAEAEKT